jgi:hypothetical protein
MNLNSVEDYWREILVPSATDLATNPSPRTVFNAALAAWHLHEWVWHERHPGVSTRQNGNFDIFQKRLLKSCPELGWLRDLADAGKHRGLDRRNIRVGSAKRRPRGGYMGSSYNASNYFAALGGGTSYSIELTDKTRQEIAMVFQKAIEFWRNVELKGSNLPSPF